MASDTGKFDELLKDSTFVTSFDEEARELIKAHLLLGRSVEDNYDFVVESDEKGCLPLDKFLGSDSESEN